MPWGVRAVVPEPDTRELGPRKPAVAVAGPIAEGIRRVLEELLVREPVQRPRREKAFDLASGYVRRGANDTLGRLQPVETFPAPGEIADNVLVHVLEGASSHA